MDPKSAFTLLFLLCASFILQIRGNRMPPNVDIGNKREGAFMLEKRLGNSPRNSSISIKDLYENNSHVASYSYSGNVLGVKATITVWKIADVQPLSSSLAYIGAHNFDNNGNDRIIAGVHVNPALYGNTDLRFFTYWSSGNHDCYNLNCPGFVVADGQNLYPGQALSPLSNYGGPERYITIRIKKDLKTGDWSLYREDKGGPIGGMTLLGWWPRILFAGLSNYATNIEWTGAVYHGDSETSPSMGSGHFSSELNQKAASFKQITAFDSWQGEFRPSSAEIVPFMDRKDCYTLSPWYATKHSDATHFFYGGPGGCFDKMPG